MEIKKFKIFLTIGSVSIYLISLTQTAISADALADKSLSGMACLFIGGIAILGGGLYEWLIWLANPLYFYGVFYFLKQNKRAKFYTIVAAVISAFFSTWSEILVSESGAMGEIDSLGLGYWLWVLSLSIMAIGAFYISKTESKINEKDYSTT